MMPSLEQSKRERLESQSLRKTRLRAAGLAAFGALILAIPLACSKSDAFSTPPGEEQAGDGGGAGAPFVEATGGKSAGRPPRSTSSGGADGAGGTGDAVGMSGAAGAGGSEVPDVPPPPVEHRGCSIEGDCAVFVKAGTNGAGTRTSPVGRVTDGVALAVEQGKTHVFVCEGTYYETLKVEAGPEPVLVVAGLDCESWDLGGETQVIANENETAFDIRSREVELERIAFRVPNATQGNSATGGYVVDANVTLQNSSIVVGDGANGVAPSWGVTNYSDNKGNPATSTGPGATKLNCGSIGGQGGVKGGAAATAGLPDLPGAGGEAGQNSAAACYIGGPGVDGADAAAVPDAAGAKIVGRWVGDRWQGEHGTAGSSGLPGQGGGGGGASANLHGHGGSAGGCGGAGGRPGKAGGSSLGVVAVRSSLTLTSVSITTGAGGIASKGAAGQTGQTGGARVVSGSACSGGAGGDGSNGGAGGGAAGGISVPVLHTVDSELVIEDSTLTPGLAGPAGVGGKPGVNDGIAGVSKAKLAL